MSRARHASARIALSLCALALAAAPAQAEAYRVVKIALDGETAPGTGGGVFDLDFTQPSLNGNGKVSFASTVTGGAAGAGVFRGETGGVTAVAVAGEATPVGGTYGPVFGLDPGVDDAGRVSFLGIAVGGAASHGLFVDAGAGAGAARVVPGDATPVGGSYTATVSELSQHGLTGTGGVVFSSAVTGGARAAGVFLASAGGHSAVSLAGDAAPGSGGGSYASFDPPAANAAGDVAFTADVTGGATAHGLFLDQAGTDRAVALAGEGAPDTGGGTYLELMIPAVGSGADVAFIASVDDGGAGLGGLFVEADGTDRAVALENGTAPGTGGGTYTTLTSLPAVDGRGRVPFSVELSGGSVAAGIFLFDPASGETAPLLLAGETAPDSGGQTFSSFGYLASDDRGRIATLATLSGGGQGLFLLQPLAEVPALPGAGLWLAGLALALLGAAATRSRR